MVGSAGDPIPVAVALGSNLGDRKSYLDDAVAALSVLLESLSVSTYHETEPVGVGDQPLFLNAAAIGTTTLGVADVLQALLEIEHQMGRKRPFPGAPRTVDLDLILHGRTIVSTAGLTVPHPRFRDRMFVLAPLAELAGDWVDPVTGKSVAELLRIVTDRENDGVAAGAVDAGADGKVE